MKSITFLGHIWAFFTKKRIIWTLVILLILLAGWFLFFRKSSPKNIQSVVIKTQDIKKTVLTTGQVVSSTDLSLSFQTSGIVKKINVKEGDRVSAGQVLAVLDQGNILASVESSNGSLAQSQASVNSAQTSLNNAKENLKEELSNKAFNDANTAILSSTNLLFSNPQAANPQFSIVGTVQTNSQLVINVNSGRITVNTILDSWQKEVAGFSANNTDVVMTDSLKNLTTISKYFSDIISLLSTYTQITSGGSQTTISSYVAEVASAKATVDSAYSRIISDAQAVKSAESALEQAKASVLSAQGGVHSAQVGLSSTEIIAPASGTITQVDIKLGEQGVASKEVIKLLNIGELHTEADVSEADIASLKVGQTIDYTFDALGPDAHFTNKILTINPASTVVSGVVNYKITGGLTGVDFVKPGMTANMTILVEEKKNILATPSSSIINKDGKKFVRVINDPKEKTYNEVEVTTGLDADGGLVEILSGLSASEEVVTYIK